MTHSHEPPQFELDPKQWPNNRGGLLVIPIEHHENVDDLPPSAAG